MSRRTSISRNGMSDGIARGCSSSWRWAAIKYEQSATQSMVTSRPVPQQTAQMDSPFAGQYRDGFRFSQIGHATESSLDYKQNNRQLKRIKSQRMLTRLTIAKT